MCNQEKTQKQLLQELKEAKLRIKELEEKNETDLRKYSLMVEGANDGIIIIQNGHIKYVNHVLEDFFKKSNEDVLDTLFPDFFYPESLPIILERYQQRMAGIPTPSIYEASLKKHYVTPLMVEINVKKINYEGSPADLILVRDISDRKKLEEQVTVFMESAPVAFYHFDEKLILTDINTTAVEKFLHGTSKKDFLNRHIADIVPNIKESERYQKYLQVLKTGKPIQLDQVTAFPQFGEQYYSIRAFRVGKGLGIISSDITERVKAEQTVRQVKQQLQDIFDHTPLTVYVKDLDGRYLLVNKVWREKTGLKEQDVIGRTDSELFPYFSHGLWDDNEKIVFEGGKSIQFEEIGRTTGLIYLSTKFLLHDNNGNAYALCSSSLDITKRKKMQEALKKSEEKYRMLVEKMEEAVFLEDTEGFIRFVNQRGIRMLDYPENEILGKHWSIFAPKEVLKKSKMESARRPLGISGKYESAVQTKDDRIIPIKITATPLFTEEKEFNGVLCVFTDLTERLLAEEQLKRVKREEELYHTMQSHFIKNDLQKIQFALELKQRSGDCKDKEDLQEIIEICHRTDKTIDRINKIYSVLQSDFELEKSKYSFLNLIRDISTKFKISIRIECDIVELQLLVDAFFSDLLSEILQFISKSTDKEVSISCDWPSQDKLNFKISIKEHFTDPLPLDLCKRIPQAVTEEWESLGHFIGLTLASVIAQYYGGKLLITPLKDKGNEFTIVLPSGLIIEN